MVTSQSMRHYYPELIVGGVDESWNVYGDRPSCDYTPTVKVRFLAGGAAYPHGYIDLRVHPAAAPWARALAAVMLYHGYTFRETSGGTLSCRKITGGSKTSLHTHGVAIDFNPSKNRYRYYVGPIQWGIQTDMPQQMIEDIKTRITTVDGRRITVWGGDWTNTKDPMHFQPSGVTRTQLELGIDYGLVTGWNTYKQWAELEETFMLTPGSQGNAVKWFQTAINAWIDYFTVPIDNLAVDGVYGNATTAAVKKYQESAGLDQTGNIGAITDTLLNSYHPTQHNAVTTKELGEALASLPPVSGLKPGDTFTATITD